MNTPTLTAWTPAARAALDSWLARRLRPEVLDGADAGEVRADLTAHLHEELAATGATTVTADILTATLARMGETPGLSPLTNFKPATAAGPAADGQWPRLSWPRCFFVLAVVLPVLAWAVESVSGWCATLIFAPLPTLWHHLIVLSAPLAGILIWQTAQQQSPGSARLLRVASWLTGAGLAAALYYTLLFAPFTPHAFMGIIIWGAGLLPLSALAAFLSLLRARKFLAARRRAGGPEMRAPVSRGMLAMAAVIVMVDGPSMVTRVAIHRAANSRGDAEEIAAAAKLVRSFGSEAALLRACYDSGSPRIFERAAPDPATWIAEWLGLDRGLSGWQFKRGWEGDDVLTRDLYFRVTGRPFNSEPRPRIGLQRHGGWGDWDTARGGEAVAGQISGLSLAESRLDWHCESASGLTWGEWTFVFSNSTNAPQEARCRVALPPDGFVSRVVLWVNGEMQEAAYGSTPQVRAAYKSVAVAQRRDPVLVTQPDAGSIMIQAFPVPAGGTLKTRVTFTAPVLSGKVWLPSITERNFTIAEKTRALLWVQADAGTLASAFDESRTATDQGWQTLTATPLLTALTGSGGRFTWNAAAAPVVWCENSFAAPEHRTLVRKTDAKPAVAAGAMAWVVDGSAAMRPFAASLAPVISSAGGTAVRIFIAGDSPSELTATDRGADVASFKYAGGRDNTPALAAALDWLRGRPDATLVWLHGPQPVVSRSLQQIEQILERSPHAVRLLDVPLVQGDNALLPVFTRTRELRCRTVRTSAAAPFSTAALQETEAAFTWEQHAALPPDVAAVKVNDTLSRQFALAEYRRLRSADPEQAAATAVRASLVTPDTGAVVLERATDYSAHNLAQASSKAAQQIPVVPEPSTALLAAGAALLLTLRRRRAF
jgi:hypothetical protein